MAPERLSVTDRRGDVLEVEEGATSGVPAPDDTFDIWRSTFRHTSERVVVRVLRFGVLSEHVRRTWQYAWLDDGLSRTVGPIDRTRWLAAG